MRRLWLILVILFLMAACETLPADDLTATADLWTPTRETDTPFATNTPTQDTYFPSLPDKNTVIPGDGFKVLTGNPRLEFVDPVRTERWVDGVLQWQEQCRPRGYDIYNLYQDIDGHQGPHTRLIEVFADGLGCRADVSIYAGETGLATVFEVDEVGCHVIKIGGAYAIIDSDFWTEDHAYNYGVRPYLRSGVGDRSVDLDRYTFPDLVGTFDRHWPIWIGAPGTYELTGAVSVAYPTAEPSSDQRPLGSWIRLEVIAIAYDEDGDHCREGTPGI